MSATTLIQDNGQWLEIEVPPDATSIYLYVVASYEALQPAPEPEPEPEPSALGLTTNNLCYSNALISSPGEPDLFKFPGGSSVGFIGRVFPDDPRLIYDSLSGRQMCAIIDRTGVSQCGIDGIVASDLIDGDYVRLECPDNGPPRPDVDTTIPVSVGTTQTSPNLVIQVGCEPDSYCLSYTSGAFAYHTFDYPIFSPMARLRVRIFAATGNNQRLSYAQWSVRFSGGPQESFYQPKGEWLYITVPTDATSVEIQGNGFEEGSIPL